MNSGGDDGAPLELNDPILVERWAEPEFRDGSFPDDGESPLLRRLFASEEEFAFAGSGEEADDDRISRTRAKRSRRLRRMQRRGVAAKGAVGMPDADDIRSVEQMRDASLLPAESRPVPRKTVEGGSPRKPAVHREKGKSEFRTDGPVRKRAARISSVSRKVRRTASEIEATVAPAPEPKPLKVIRRRKAEEPKVFVTQPKSVPNAMMEGTVTERDDTDGSDSE
jgi:hypothetical protein